LSHGERPSPYPRAVMLSSIDARLAGLVAMRLAVPLLLDAVAEMTPGNAASVFEMRRSHAEQAVPPLKR
jgi:hypothetical protein